MIDRLVHHAEVISLKGDSYRPRHRRPVISPDQLLHSSQRGVNFQASERGQFSADADNPSPGYSLAHFLFPGNRAEKQVVVELRQRYRLRRCVLAGDWDLISGPVIRALSEAVTSTSSRCGPRSRRRPA
jgi:hypothetical protein